jgi:hypothetical protein
MERMIDVFGYRYHIEKRLKSEDVEVVGTDEGWWQSLSRIIGRYHDWDPVCFDGEYIPWYVGRE